MYDECSLGSNLAKVIQKWLMCGAFLAFSKNMVAKTSDSGIGVEGAVPSPCNDIKTSMTKLGISCVGGDRIKY